MSARSVERALTCLADPGAVLARERGGDGYGVFARGDLRRRPKAKLAAPVVRDLVADGAIAAIGVETYALSAAGVARVRRGSATESERYLAQHAALCDRDVIDAQGRLSRARALAASDVIRRLAALRDAAGAPWLSGAEIAAAQDLRTHWETGQSGLARGSDWTAPPLGSNARGPSNAQERVLAARCDARRRTSEALDALAPPLRRVVERVCLHEEGLEASERALGWPARSGKLALKLGLAQLALGMRRR